MLIEISNVSLSEYTWHELTEKSVLLSAQIYKRFLLKQFLRWMAFSGLTYIIDRSIIYDGSFLTIYL